MGLANLLFFALGVALIAIGGARGRGPWTRYQALKAHDANISRYESWRGGVRDTGPTGASVALEMLRRQVRDAGILVAIGLALLVIGLFWG